MKFKSFRRTGRFRRRRFLKRKKRRNYRRRAIKARKIYRISTLKGLRHRFKRFRELKYNYRTPSDQAVPTIYGSSVKYVYFQIDPAGVPINNSVGINEYLGQSINTIACEFICDLIPTDVNTDYSGYGLKDIFKFVRVMVVMANAKDITPTNFMQEIVDGNIHGRVDFKVCKVMMDKIYTFNSALTLSGTNVGANTLTTYYANLAVQQKRKTIRIRLPYKGTYPFVQQTTTVDTVKPVYIIFFGDWSTATQTTQPPVTITSIYHRVWFTDTA